jgi:uncharacterized protein YraI
MIMSDGKKTGWFRKLLYLFGALIAFSVVRSILSGSDGSSESVYVVGELVNLRLGPGTNHPTLSQATLGDRLTVVGTDQGWLHVVSDGDTAWIHADLTGSRADLQKKRTSLSQVVTEKAQPEETRASARETVFTEADFYWDEETSPHKDVIIAGVNKVYRENALCKSLDPSSAYISAERGTPQDPVFFVYCGSSNVFFSKSDVEDDRSMAVGHIDDQKAVDLCEAAAKENATHPSTVDFSTFMDLAVTQHPNGNTTLNSSFTAKNSFGLELTFNIRCLFDGVKLLESNISEK